MLFLLVFAIIITVYFLANVFIFRKAWPVISSYPGTRRYLRILFWVLPLLYPAGRILERVYPCFFSDILIWGGAIWLAFLLYFFLICLFIGFLRFLNRFWSFMPPLFFRRGFKLAMLSGIIGLVSLLVTAGIYNARTPVIKHIDIHIPKDGGARDSINAVMVSDIHLGTLVGNRHLQRIISTIKTLDPEIVFFAGDLVDEDLQAVLRQNLGCTFNNLRAPLGVYAVTGNHEYIGGVRKAVNYLESHNVTFVRDTALKIADSFYLVGREDIGMIRFEGQKRKPLEELIALTDKSSPVILMDHQPLSLQKAAKAGVDLQLSGHTHHGQMWPVNYITSAIFKVSRGYEKVEGMHVFVSSGAGTWGPPVRIGSKAEIIQLNITFR
ncbi:MAG: metallophosphoesterase [Bacteroidales bacterium]